MTETESNSVKGAKATCWYT